MRKSCLIIVLLFFSVLPLLNAQTTKIDSLENLLQQHIAKDAVRVNLINEIAANYKKNKSPKVLEYAQEAMELADKLNYAKGKAESLSLTGEYYKLKSIYPKAIENHKSALKIFEELGDKKRIAIELIYIGLIFTDQGDYSQALKYYQKSLKIREEQGDKAAIANTLGNIGIIYYYKGNYPQTLEYYKKSLKISEEIGDKSGMARAFNNIGIICKLQSNYPQSLEYYQKALSIKEEIGDFGGIANTLNNIGNIYNVQENNSKALEYYQKSLKIKEEIGDKKGTSNSLINIGEIFEKQGNYHDALKYYQKSLLIKEELGDKKGIAIVFSNFGLVYNNQGDYTDALECFHKSLKIREEIGDKLGISSSCFYIGTIYLKTNKFNQALDYTNKSLKIAKELELLFNQKEIYEQLSKIYAAKKNHKKAYESHLLYKELNDSIFNEKNIKKITSLELEYKFEKEKQAIELIQQKKDAITQKEIKYQKTIRNVFITGLFVAVLIILLFYRIVQIKKKVNNLLQQKNEEIILQKDQIYEQKSEIEVQAEELAAQKENLEEIVEQRTASFVKAKERAEESDQLKTAFLNNISHEFRTPMNGILGFSSLLIKPGSSSDDQKKYAEIISKSGNQLLNIVNDTVEISKIHSKQAKVYKSIVNISSIISEFINEFQESAILKGIDIKFELNLDKEQLLIEIDESKIERILWHLIDNAIKFTYGGYVNIIGQAVEDNQIQFQVEDTGIGIPQELQEKIFDPFRQVESGSARNFGGNGIGLSLAKAYVEMLGGKIWLESEIEKGTTVFFTIPIQKSTKTETKKQITATRDINNKTILIAEDNELNYLLLEEILSNYNVKLLHAWNGKEAFTILAREKHIDLILMDLKMPVMDGYEALKQIKEIKPNIPIIAQTAYASDIDREAINVAGFDDYITKPINEDKLVEILKQRV